MLFSGLACFSPSVAPMIRKLWVKNGGTLTHTDADFKKANYFFCNGMDDPWLNELRPSRIIILLLSRCLIVRLGPPMIDPGLLNKSLNIFQVRHASWVTLCVDEDFRMPIAAYTLDDGFDLTKIRILEPPDGGHGPIQPNPAVPGVTNSIEVPTDIIPRKTEAISRKRPFDNDYDSAREEEQRPRKKARIDADVEVVFPKELYDHRLAVKEPLPPLLSTATHESRIVKSDDIVPRRRFAIFRKSSKKASQARVEQRFLSQIRRTSVDDDPIVNTSALNPFSLFWNNLLETHLSGDGTRTTPLTLSVDDLLRAPKTRATIFAVNTDYLGRTFVDSGSVTQQFRTSFQQ